LYGPKDSVAVQSTTGVSDGLSRKVFTNVHAQSHPDIEGVEVHMRGKELESVDEIVPEYKAFPGLLCLEVLTALGCRHRGPTGHEERCFLLHM